MKKTAYCKINLTLEILGTKRDDGFHDIKSVMHKIPLGDEIVLEAKDGSGKIDFSCDSCVCEPEKNLAFLAAKSYLDKYLENTGRNADVTISLKKITPTGAGLGGGSADAACVLDMLSQKIGGVSGEQVLEIASRLGSDVPFCLERYMCAVCSGRGEVCENISTLPRGTCLVVAKPHESINTKGIYAEYDKNFGEDYSKCKTDTMREALKEGKSERMRECAVNDFESICISRLGEIGHIKQKISSQGAFLSQMSGSGSAVFGLFERENEARMCYEALKKDGLSQVYFFDDEAFIKMYKGE